MGIEFRFELMPVAEVAPWGSGRTLHWFGLTDGWFCPDVHGIELLRYTEETLRGVRTRSGPPWAEYYVVRFWEDLLQALPCILEPVPNDLVDFVADGVVRWDEVADDALIDAVVAAVDDRFIDTGYLRFEPGLRWWRTTDPVDTITLDWRFAADPDGEIAFTAPQSGRVSMGTAEFVAAVTEFDRLLIATMQDRVDGIARNGGPVGVDVDIPGLVREQAERRTWLSRALARAVHTDWDAVRAGMAILSGAGGHAPP